MFSRTNSRIVPAALAAPMLRFHSRGSQIRRREERRRGDEIRVEIPVEDRALARRVIAEERRIERQPHEHRGEQRAAQATQPAVRNAREEPHQRRAFERPADRDPLLVELQRNGHGDERQRGAGHERQAREPRSPAARCAAGARAARSSTIACATGSTPIM